VIFENNSEPAAENVKKACSPTIFRISGDPNIREEQGALFGRITDRRFGELGSVGC
jgi:hypothetical protein